MAHFPETDPTQFDEETQELFKLRPIEDSKQMVLAKDHTRYNARQFMPPITTLPREELDPHAKGLWWKLPLAGAYFAFASWNFALSYYPYGDIIRASQKQSWLRYAWHKGPICLFVLGAWYVTREMPRAGMMDLTDPSEE